MVGLILITLFLAAGIHLIIYSKKRRRMLKKFAQKNNLQYTPQDRGRLEAELNEKVALQENGLSRSFMKIKDIVTDDKFFLFRCIELLDLNLYGTSEITHQNHICISFDVPKEINLFFIIDKNGNQKNLYPKNKEIEKDQYFKKIKHLIHNDLQKNSVTISFRGGKAILYTNPLITGGEKEEDLEYLLFTAKSIKSKLMSL